MLSSISFTGELIIMGAATFSLPWWQSLLHPLYLLLYLLRKVPKKQHMLELSYQRTWAWWVQGGASRGFLTRKVVIDCTVRIIITPVKPSSLAAHWSSGSVKYSHHPEMQGHQTYINHTHLIQHRSNFMQTSNIPFKTGGFFHLPLSLRHRDLGYMW